MKFLKKWKVAVASALAVCCLGTAAVGVALTTATPVAAAGEVYWDGMGGTVIGDVTVADKAVSVRNNVDITKLPNKTGVFYMYYTDSGTEGHWSGFSFRNGNGGVGYQWDMGNNPSADIYPWHTLGFQEEMHMILHDNRQFTNGTLGGVKGVDGAKFMDGMVPVEIHLGEGSAAGDPSYVKVGGYELKQEDDATKAITLPWTRAAGTSKELVASMFPQGCYVTINHNFGSADVHSIALSDVGSVVGLNASMGMKSVHQAGEFSEALTMDLEAQGAFKSGYSVTAYVNGNALGSDAVTVNRTDDDKASVSISAETLNAIPDDQLKPTSYFSFEVKNGETDYGSAVVATKVVFEPPAQFEEESKTLTSLDAFSFKFTYEGSVNPETDATLSYRYAASGSATALEKGTDYTVTKSGDKDYTLTITKTAAEKLFNGHVSVFLLAKVGPGDPITLSVLVEGVHTNEWGVRYRQGIDYVDGTLKQDEFYSSAKMKKLNTEIHASRLVYEDPVPVNKPIVVEYSTLPTSATWMLLSVMRDLSISEFFDENTSWERGNLCPLILFGQNRHDVQAYQAALQQNGVVNDNTVAYKEVTNNKNNVVEIYFGETKDQGYVKINGFQLMLKPNRTQADFPNGQAYVGFFFNNQSEDFDFTVNTHLNAVAITAPQADSEYAMDLGDAGNFEVELINASDKLTLKDEKGTVIPKEMYTVTSDASSGVTKLTIKAEYFSTRTYSARGQILIWDETNNTGTGFWMDFTNSSMEPAHVQYLTKGALQDVTFDLGISEISYVLKGGERLSSENYTFQGGKFTVKQAAIENEIGLQEVIIGGTDGKVYPCYIYVNDWKDGVATNGDGTLGGDAASGYTLSGKISFDEMKAYDLSKGVTFGVEFATIDGYNENNLNKNPHTVLVIKFYDPGKGITVQFTLYPNYADNKIATGNEALYLRYETFASDGSAIKSNKIGVMARSASGNHNLTVTTTDNGGLEITYAGYAYSLKRGDLDGFNATACVLTVDALDSTDGSVVKLTVQDGVHEDERYTGDDDPGTTPENPGEQDGGGAEEEGGCGSVISGSGIALLAALALGAAVFPIVRRKRD